jgi:hypothetical protein
MELPIRGTIASTHHLSKYNQEFHLNVSQAFGTHSTHLKNNSMSSITVCGNKVPQISAYLVATVLWL